MDGRMKFKKSVDREKWHGVKVFINLRKYNCYSIRTF